MEIRKMDREIAAQISGWQYSGELAIYSQEDIADNSSDYFAIYENAILVGFGVVGDEAMVKEQSPSYDYLDVGLGMNPDLIRRGNGRDFTLAVLENAKRIAAGKGFRGLRCAILDWNIVSQKMATTHGFRHARDISNDGGTFKEFELDISPGL
jgi:hypothetical protein